MTTLHLGEVDIPYVNDGKTTVEVARILEAKYHVIEVFSEIHRDLIETTIVESLQDAVTNMLMGAPVSVDPYGDAMAVIGARFKTFIDMKEMEHLGIPGVPTQAAKDGVSHRFKSKRGPKNRPSFQDTGLFEDSFVPWVE
jgi:hypothetical protein